MPYKPTYPPEYPPPAGEASGVAGAGLMEEDLFVRQTAQLRVRDVEGDGHGGGGMSS